MLFTTQFTISSFVAFVLTYTSSISKYTALLQSSKCSTLIDTSLYAVKSKEYSKYSVVCNTTTSYTCCCVDVTVITNFDFSDVGPSAYLYLNENSFGFEILFISKYPLFSSWFLNLINEGTVAFKSVSSSTCEPSSCIILAL